VGRTGHDTKVEHQLGAAPVGAGRRRQQGLHLLGRVAVAVALSQSRSSREDEQTRALVAVHMRDVPCVRLAAASS
jgi:hypothetical protein